MKTIARRLRISLSITQLIEKLRCHRQEQVTGGVLVELFHYVVGEVSGIDWVGMELTLPNQENCISSLYNPFMAMLVAKISVLDWVVMVILASIMVEKITT